MLRSPLAYTDIASRCLHWLGDVPEPLFQVKQQMEAIAQENREGAIALLSQSLRTLKQMRDRLDGAIALLETALRVAR